MGKVKQLMTDFESRLQERKRKLDDSVKLHRLTEVVRMTQLYHTFIYYKSLVLTRFVEKPWVQD